MKEYIEKAAVKDEILSWAVCINRPELLSKEDTMHCIDNMPSANVAEVVRCRNCKRAYANANDPGVIYCGWSKEPTPPDGFCHRGEREQNGQGGRP